MPVRVKKLIGTIALVIAVSVYALLVMSIGEARFAQAGSIAQLCYFAFFGLVWIIPAGLLIRWMERSDRPR